MSEQTTHQEIDGEILPPDPQQLSADDPNAPHMFFDRYNPHDPPEPIPTQVPEADPDKPVGQLSFSTPMPQKLKDLKNSLPKHKPRKTHRDTTMFHRGRGYF